MRPVLRRISRRDYNRTAFLKARKEMMQGWADYLDGLRRSAPVLLTVFSDIGRSFLRSLGKTNPVSWVSE
jgi:hypothetical protein